MLLNPNGILLFSVQFGFNDPMGKFEHLNDFFLNCLGPWHGQEPKKSPKST
jgi:hypothetical protein